MLKHPCITQLLYGCGASEEGVLPAIAVLRKVGGWDGLLGAQQQQVAVPRGLGQRDGLLGTQQQAAVLPAGDGGRGSDG